MDKEEYLKHIKELISNTAEDSIEYVKVWKEHVLFTWQWWFSLVLFIIPIIVWFMVLSLQTNSEYPSLNSL